METNMAKKAVSSIEHVDTNKSLPHKKVITLIQNDYTIVIKNTWMKAMTFLMFNLN